MRELAYYSHSNSIVFEPAITSACEMITPKVQAREWTPDANLRDYSLLVVHGNPAVEMLEAGSEDREFRYLKTYLSRVQENHKGDQDLIIIDLSSSVRSKKSWREGREGCRVTVLYVNNAKAVGLGTPSDMDDEQLQVSSSHWVSFLTALYDPKALDEFFSGRLASSGSRIIDQYLNGPPRVDLLPAISILCQGYLVTHCAPDGSAEVSKDKHLVEDALTEMGWMGREDDEKGVLQSDEAKRWITPCLLEADPASIPEDGSPSRHNLQAQVKTVGFWSVLFSQGLSDVAELQARILAEWGDKDVDKRNLIVALTQNLTPLADDQSNADASCDPGPTVVANAYFALQVKLGGASE